MFTDCRVSSGSHIFFIGLMQKNVASYVVVMSPHAHSFDVAIYTYTYIHFPLSVSVSSYARQFVLSSVRLEKKTTLRKR